MTGHWQSIVTELSQPNKTEKAKFDEVGKIAKEKLQELVKAKKIPASALDSKATVEKYHGRTAK